MLREIFCVPMRGGSPGGLFFLASDRPAERAVRDRLPLSAMNASVLHRIDAPPHVAVATVVAAARSLGTGNAFILDQARSALSAACRVGPTTVNHSTCLQEPR